MCTRIHAHTHTHIHYTTSPVWTLLCIQSCQSNSMDRNLYWFIEDIVKQHKYADATNRLVCMMRLAYGDHI